VDYGQIITEYWIEPQVGTARCTSSEGNAYMDGLTFREIGLAVSLLLRFVFTVQSYRNRHAVASAWKNEIHERENGITVIPVTYYQGNGEEK
jgi:hypothetical protein